MAELVVQYVLFQQLKEEGGKDVWPSPVATIHAVVSTDPVTTTSSTATEIQNFTLLVGNISSSNFCNITPSNFDKLTTLYHQVCIKGEPQPELPEEKDAEG